MHRAEYANINVIVFSPQTANLGKIFHTACSGKPIPIFVMYAIANDINRQRIGSVQVIVPRELSLPTEVAHGHGQHAVHAFQVCVHSSYMHVHVVVGTFTAIA